MKVTDKIRTIRELNHWTQEDMANKIHMSAISYAKLERGDRKLSLEELERIAVALSIDITELLSSDKQNILCFINSDSNQNISYYAQQDLGIEIDKLKSVIEFQKSIIDEKTRQVEQQAEHITALNLLIKALNDKTS